MRVRRPLTSCAWRIRIRCRPFDGTVHVRDTDRNRDMTDASTPPLLVVEDEQAVLGLLATWLNDEGYEIVTCSRYEDARRYLATHTPAALVTDIRLGAYNGLQ